MGSVDSTEHLLGCDFNSFTEQASDVSIFTFPPHSRGATQFAYFDTTTAFVIVTCNTAVMIMECNCSAQRHCDWP